VKSCVGLFLLAVLMLFGPLRAQAAELKNPNFNQGSLYFSQGRLKEARNALIRAVELNEPVAEVYTLLGQVLERANEVDLAIEMLSLGAERFPALPEIFSELGHFYLLKDQFQEGIKAILSALSQRIGG